MYKLFHAIEQRLGRDPEDIFLEEAGVVYKVKDLIHSINNIKSALRNTGAKPGVRIAVALPIGLDFIASMVSILQEGMSYVPLSDNGPRNRSLNMARAAGVHAVISEDILFLPDNVHNSLSIKTSNNRTISITTCSFPVSVNKFVDEAYVIFTSGSTGTPKGVSISRKSIDFYWKASSELYSLIGKKWTVPLSLPPTFDASLTSILALLTTNSIGITLTPESPTASLAELLGRNSQNVFLKTTPSQLRLACGLLEKYNNISVSGAFIIGGEQLYFQDIKTFKNCEGLKIFNEYGPTEATVGCMVYSFDATTADTGPVPIGTPIIGAEILLEPASGEDASELLISGPGLSNGYIDEPSSSKFVRRFGRIYYKTGDLIRTDPENKLLYFAGRKDNQIKLNGYRIDMSEVESALRAEFPDVEDATAIVHDSKIIAFLSGRERYNQALILSKLRQKLPSYMVPDKAIFVESFPVTAHGKSSREILIEQMYANNSAGDDGIYGDEDLHKTVASIWSDVLSCGQVEPESNFFECGGDSLAALKFTGMLSEKISEIIPVTLIFDASKFNAFMQELKEFLRSRRSQHVNNPERPSFNQLSIAAAHMASDCNSAYTVVSAVKVSRISNLDLLCRSIDSVIKSCDVFHWLPYRHPRWLIAVSRRPVKSPDVEFIDSVSDETSFVKNCREECVDIFADRSPVRFSILNKDSPEPTIVLKTHHFFVDEISISLIWEGIFSLYSGRLKTKPYEFNYRNWVQDQFSKTRDNLIYKNSAEVAESIKPHVKKIGAALGKNEDNSLGFSQSISFLVPESCVSNYRASQEFSLTDLQSALSASAAHVLARFFGLESLLLFQSVTQRSSKMDFGSVGCYIANLPVIFNAPAPGRSAIEIVSSWKKLVRDLLSNARADPINVSEIIEKECACWAKLFRISIVTERRVKGKNKEISWEARDAPIGNPKFDLTWIFSIGAGSDRVSSQIVLGSQLPGVDLSKFRDAFFSTINSISEGDGQVPDLGEFTFHKIDIPKVESERDNVPMVGASLYEDLTDLPNIISGLYSDVLGVVVLPSDDPFRLGMSSLVSLKVLSRLHDAGYEEIRISDIYEFRTAERLARYLSAVKFMQE